MARAYRNLQAIIHMQYSDDSISKQRLRMFSPSSMCSTPNQSSSTRSPGNEAHRRRTICHSSTSKFPLLSHSTTRLDCLFNLTVLEPYHQISVAKRRLDANPAKTILKRLFAFIEKIAIPAARSICLGAVCRER